ncbi:hypothetical protein B0T14DRAFT_504752 [Immersiella caudata]|uniref:BZIP domain-containing protein n=1 Tax=Immersiella caudata TaxID=314043 RepID=A0AA39XES4_9PEZI|nr:hypothetical protein B0T14DRAFT_504752 [Immersiella caudata]
MNRGDQDDRHRLQNLAGEYGGVENWIPLEAGNNASHTHWYEPSTESPIGSGFHQYPLTPFEDPSLLAPLPPHNIFQPSLELSHAAASPTETGQAFESNLQPLGQTWPVNLALQQLMGLVGGLDPGMPLDVTLPTGPLQDLGYFPPTAAEPFPLGAPTGEEPAHSWGGFAPGSAFVRLAGEQHDAQAKDENPQLEKVKKKRGRPRLYGDDGTERSKRKPGRPPTYVVSESGSPSSSFQAFRFASAVSDSNSTLGTTWPRADQQELEPTVSTRVSSNKNKEKAKAQPASIGGDDDDDEEEKDTQRQEIVRARNKTAASRYRAKTQAAIAIMEAEEREVSSQRQELLACATQLREEVFHLKNEILRQAACRCPLITGYLAGATRLPYSGTSPLGHGRAESISSGMESMALSGDGSLVVHREGCTDRGGGFGEPTDGSSAFR